MLGRVCTISTPGLKKEEKGLTGRNESTVRTIERQCAV
jgi:hypothetical protein